MNRTASIFHAQPFRARHVQGLTDDNDLVDEFSIFLFQFSQELVQMFETICNGSCVNSNPKIESPLPPNEPSASP
jgi:hypothetical protein